MRAPLVCAVSLLALTGCASAPPAREDPPPAVSPDQQEREYWPTADAECVLYAYQYGFDPNSNAQPDLAQLAERGLLPDYLADGRHEGWCFRGGVHAPDLELARELGVEPVWRAWAYTWPEEPREGETCALYRQWAGYPWSSSGPTALPPLPHEASHEDCNSRGWYVEDHPAELRTGPVWAENKDPPE